MALATSTISCPAGVWTSVSSNLPTVIVQVRGSSPVEVFVGDTVPTGTDNGVILTGIQGTDALTLTDLVTEEVYVRPLGSTTSVVVIKG